MREEGSLEVEKDRASTAIPAGRSVEMCRFAKDAEKAPWRRIIAILISLGQPCQAWQAESKGRAHHQLHFARPTDDENTSTLVAQVVRRVDEAKIHQKATQPHAIQRTLVNRGSCPRNRLEIVEQKVSAATRKRLEPERLFRIAAMDADRVGSRQPQRATTDDQLDIRVWENRFRGSLTLGIRE